MKKGYFGIGIENPKKNENVGTLIRHAYLLGASYVFIIGRKYKKHAADTGDFGKLMPIYEFETIKEFTNSTPKHCELIGIDINNYGDKVPKSIVEFEHPRNAVYILGNESGGLSKEALNSVSQIVYIPTKDNISFNVATTGAMFLFDRVFNKKDINNG